MGEQLTGRRIVVPETRELALFETMLRERGAIPVACPLVAIRDVPDSTAAEAWLRRFIAAPADALVLLTGEGLRRLLGLAQRIGVRDAFVAALVHPRKITRGPKPVRALREIGLDADMQAPLATSAGVVEVLQRLDLAGLRVGVQLYPDNDHRLLLGYLAEARAEVDAVLPYVYGSQSDDETVLGIIARMAAGEMDAIAFTSASQVRRFHEVAAAAGRSEEAREALGRVLVAAIGPVVKDELAAFGVRPDVTPAGETYFMKPLVRGLAEAFARGRVEDKSKTR
jgi:uroporphyrinogen-III synthase